MKIELLPLQQATLAVPTSVGCIASGGSKGGGKTASFWLKQTQRVQTLKGDYAGVFARVSFPALQTPYEDALTWFTRLGLRPNPNRHDMTIRFPAYGNSTLRFMVLDSRQAVLERTSGMSLTDVVVDELQTFPTFELPNLLIGCLRAPPHIPTLLMLSFNPGGVGASNIRRAIIAPAKRLPPGTPFYCEALARTTVLLESNYRANKFIDREAYARSLVAMSGGNAQFLEQIDRGNWDTLVGSFFSLTDHSYVDWPACIDWNDYGWLTPKASMDWGSSSPYAITLALRVDDRGTLPCGRRLARGSLIIFDELTSADENQGWARAAHFAAVPEIARAFLHKLDALGLPRLRLHSDLAIFAEHGSAQGSLATEFQLAGVNVTPAPKPKLRASFPQLRERVWAAASDDALPCIVFARDRVPYHLAAFTNAPTAANNPETVDDKYPLMHALDSARYLMHAVVPATAGRQVISQHMDEVVHYENPHSVELDARLAAAAAYARQRDRQRRQEFVRGPEPSDWLSKTLGSKGERRCVPDESKPPLKQSLVVRKS